MAQGISQVSSLGGLFNAIIADAITTVQETTIMLPLVTQYAARGWATREIPKYPASPTAQEVDEDQDYANPREFTKSSVTLTPKEFMVQAILTDRRLSTDPDGAMSDCREWLARSLRNKMELDLLTLFSSFTNGIGTATANLTLDKVRAALAILRNTSKGAGGISVVIHPYVWYNLADELETPAATYAFMGELANEALRQNWVSGMMGAQWFQNATISIDDEDDCYGATFTREAIAFDLRKPMTIEVERDASRRGWELNFSMAYAVGIRRDEMGVYLLGDASTPS